MMKTTALLIVSLQLLFAARAGACQAPALPNVIIVLADDLGVGDVRATNAGSKIATPSLDRLAAEGLTFLDAHSPSAVCTPTRYSLLTGRYNWRSRLERGVLDGRSEHLIPAERATLGHLLRGAGYSTAMIGKWHLGWDWAKSESGIDFTKVVTNGPDINGFDTYYAHSGSLDMPPYVWVDTGRVTAVPDREEGVTSEEDRYGWYRKGPIGADFHIEEVLPHLFGRAVEHVLARADDEQPFFLYLALPAPHTPIVPVPPFAGASQLNPYADFVMQLDHHMGELLGAVDEAEIAEETVVIFTSDNGCSPQANFELLEGHGHDPNGGYRGHKADLYEGGHRVPLIVRWPGLVKPGRTTQALVCLTDIYPTLSDLAGAERKGSGGEDGFSWSPLFEGQVETGRETLVSHSIAGYFAVRKGPWKLCLSAGSGGWSAPREAAALSQGLPAMQLYHLGEDPAETDNRLEAEPERVAELLRLLEAEVAAGRATPGRPLANDREVQVLRE